MSGRNFATRRASAGFTLVELMVAMTGGLFISLAVFALARDSGRFYQGEARIANATVGGLLGFERLRLDIARTGFMASPNAVRDTRICDKPNAAWPDALRNLASIQVTTPVTTYPALTTNGRTPPSLRLAGSYASPDLFAAYSSKNGNNIVFSLQNLTPGLSPQAALLRLGNGALPDTTTMQSVFQQARALRIVQNGFHYYGQIFSAVGGANPTVTVNAVPPILERSGAATCGLQLGGSGASKATINVVNFIQYDVGTPQTATAKANYQDLYASSNAADAAPGEAGRTELLRLERDITGVPIDGTEEVVAEYAVDFSLQFTAVTGLIDVHNPTLGVVLPGSAQFTTYSGPTFLSANTPDRIRSVRVRLGVRSRSGDRPVTIASPANAGLFRFDLGTGSDEAFARVRTFQADVMLHNQADILW